MQVHDPKQCNIHEADEKITNIWEKNHIDRKRAETQTSNCYAGMVLYR